MLLLVAESESRIQTRRDSNYRSTGGVKESGYRLTETSTTIENVSGLCFSNKEWLRVPQKWLAPQAETLRLSFSTTESRFTHHWKK